MTFYVVGVKEIDICLEYKKLTESKHKNTGRVYWQTRNGKIHGQPIGRNWFSKTFPKIMAKALKIPNWEDFSGHSLCRTAATDYANEGATLPQLKAWGGWKSDKVPMRYVDNSHGMKINAAQKLSKSIISGKKRKKPESDDDDEEESDSESESDDDDIAPSNNKKSKRNYVFNNCTVTFN